MDPKRSPLGRIDARAHRLGNAKGIMTRRQESQQEAEVNRFRYGVDGGQCGNQFRESSSQAKPRSKKEEARRLQAPGQLAYHAIWRLAVDFPEAAWSSNPQVGKMAQDALANIYPSTRAALLCESFDKVMGDDKPQIAMWIKSQGVPSAPVEGMAQSASAGYALEEIGKHRVTSQLAAASWCALAAARGAWRILEAFESDGSAAKERAGIFSALAQGINEPDVARQAMMECHPWVVGMCAMHDYPEDSAWTPQRKAMVEAWKPKNKLDAKLGWEAFAMRCVHCEVSGGIELMEQRGAPMGGLVDRWTQWAADALLDLTENSSSAEQQRWTKALCAWGESSVDGPRITRVEDVLLSTLAESTRHGDSDDIERHCKALLKAESMRSSMGWAGVDGAELARRRSELVAQGAGLDGERVGKDSRARQAMDALARAWDAEQGVAAPRGSLRV
jgi:hypothetical protein